MLGGCLIGYGGAGVTSPDFIPSMYAHALSFWRGLLLCLVAHQIANPGRSLITPFVQQFGTIPSHRKQTANISALLYSIFERVVCVSAVRPK